jgi:hypothetical protein
MQEEINKELLAALRVVIGSLNVCDGEKKSVNTVKYLLQHEHRTLQQNFMRVIIVPAIEQLALQHKNGYIDMRNEAACSLAGELHKTTKGVMLPFI